MSILNTIVVFQAFLKLLFYLTVFKEFGLLIRLVRECLNDVIDSVYFFVGLIFLFSLIFQALGLEIFLDDYFGMKIFPTYALYTYRNAIGDLDAPVYNYWAVASASHPKTAWTMIAIIWLVWILNQWIVLIIVFNLLIAIISKTYENV
jgi:hypothetical protein